MSDAKPASPKTKLSPARDHRKLVRPETFANNSINNNTLLCPSSPESNSRSSIASTSSKVPCLTYLRITGTFHCLWCAGRWVTAPLLSPCETEDRQTRPESIFVFIILARLSTTKPNQTCLHYCKTALQASLVRPAGRRLVSVSSSSSSLSPTYSDPCTLLSQAHQLSTTTPPFPFSPSAASYNLLNSN